MPNERTLEEEVEYQKALDVVDRIGYFVLQRRNPNIDEWYLINTTHIKGREAAVRALEVYKKSVLMEEESSDTSDFRVVTQSYHQATREPWNAAIKWLKKWAKRLGISLPKFHITDEPLT